MYIFIVFHENSVNFALSALEMGQEPRIVHIDFCAGFNRVNQQGILFELCSVGVGGSVLSVLTHAVSL